MSGGGEEQKFRLAEEVEGVEYKWNFAYGSNMKQSTLINRLSPFPGDPHPVESVPCVARDWVLLFDVYAHPFAEPAFANVRRAPGKECHGVIHRVTKAQYDNLAATEGGGGAKDMGYQPQEVSVETYDGRTITAIAFCQKPQAETKRDYWPSARYMNLLRNGAREYGVQTAYIEYLDSLPSFKQKPLGSLLTKVLGILLFKPFMRWPMTLNNKYLQSPKIGAWIWWFSFNFVLPIVRVLHALTFGAATHQPKYKVMPKHENFHFQP